MTITCQVEVLRKRADFLRVAASGRKWVAKGFILQIAPTPQNADPSPSHVIRYGLTASKKVGNAVVRNRARRRLRALVREVLAAEAAMGNDYVLIARLDGTVDAVYAEMATELRKALKRLQLVRAPS